jgi:DNA-binding Lrp family transcriptional regulator
MDTFDARIINQLQGDFPLAAHPFQKAAERIGLSEGGLITRIEALLQQGILTRFGPLYHAERLGGAAYLAAVAVPEAELARVTALINAQIEVAHNYQRTHTLNLWFVVAAETVAAVTAALDRIEQLIGLPVYRFPKEREYFVELKLQVAEDAAPLRPAPITTPVTRRVVPPAPVSVAPLNTEEQRVMRASQAGLPLTSQPYHALAEALGMSAAEVITAFSQMLARGAIRRIGVVPNHYALGYRANGMSVWDVADTVVDTHGAALAQLPWVSHCYRRPRALPLWPYNLFVMLHGANQAEVALLAEQLGALLAPDCRGSEILYSTQILKKTGLRSRAAPQESSPCSA